MKCPVCKEGALTPLEGTNKILYNGAVVAVHYHYSLCNTCGSEITTTEQVTRNKRIVLSIKEKL